MCNPQSGRGVKLLAVSQRFTEGFKYEEMQYTKPLKEIASYNGDLDVSVGDNPNYTDFDFFFVIVFFAVPLFLILHYGKKN